MPFLKVCAAGFVKSDPGNADYIYFMAIFS